MKRVLIVASVALLGVTVYAKPVFVKEITTPAGKVKLDVTASYTNIQQKNISVTQKAIGDKIESQDILMSDFSLRYGLTDKLEIYSTVSGQFSRESDQFAGAFSSKYHHGFSSWGAGASYRIKDEDDTPALMVGAYANIIERIKIDGEYGTNRFRNYRVYASTHYTVDPIVLSLNASYGFGREMKAGKHTLDPATTLTITPQVYFAVNPKISLNWGARYQYTGTTKVDDKKVDGAHSDVTYMTGASYELDSGDVLGAQIEYTNSVRSTQSKATLTWSHKF